MYYNDHMKHHVSQQRQPLRRTLIYSFMTLTVVAIVTIMVLLVQGYTYDSDEGTIEQGGLLQFASTPSGAAVTIDGERFGSRTNTKTTISAGEHSVQYNRNNYREWSKNVTVDPGQVVWLAYARLIPTELSPQTVRTLGDEVAATSVSPKRSYMLVQTKDSDAVFTILDLRSDTVEASTIQLPAASYETPASGQSQTFVVESWSANERFVLLKHTTAGVVEWLLLDREQPTQSININDRIAAKPNRVEFAGGSDKRFFVQTDDMVQRVDISKTEENTIPLARNVDTFSVYNEETIIFTTRSNATGSRTVDYASVGFDDNQQIVRAYRGGDGPFFAAMGSFFNEQYIAIVRGEQLIVDAGRLSTPSSSTSLRRVTLQTIPEGALQLSFSRTGRFVVIEYADKFAVYDIELDEYHETKWEHSTTRKHALRWLDDYIVWSDRGGMLRIYDFDGANQHDLMNVTPGFSATLSGNGKYLYGILQTDDGFKLRRVQLIL